MGTRAAGHLCMVEPARRATGAPPSARVLPASKLAPRRREGGQNKRTLPGRCIERARLALGGSSAALGDGSALLTPLQKVSANPYFNHTTFLPLFAFSALGAQGRAEARVWFWAARNVALGMNLRVRPLCKNRSLNSVRSLSCRPLFLSKLSFAQKCRQTPF